MQRQLCDQLGLWRENFLPKTLMQDSLGLLCHLSRKFGGRLIMEQMGSHGEIFHRALIISRCVMLQKKNWLTWSSFKQYTFELLFYKTKNISVKTFVRLVERLLVNTNKRLKSRFQIWTRWLWWMIQDPKDCDWVSFLLFRISSIIIIINPQ